MPAPRSRTTRRHKPTPWRDTPAPGPTVIIDIDGVIASMDRHEHLIAAPRYTDRDWTEFHRRFGDADVIESGRRLACSLHAAGFTVSYSTTRFEPFTSATYEWLRRHQFPLGTIHDRAFYLDGTVRPSVDVKRRHWWWYQRRTGNPVVAWIDDEPEAVDALRGEGCPAWDVTDLLAVAANPMGGTLADALAATEALSARIPAALAAWTAEDAAWMKQREVAMRRHRKRMLTRRMRASRGQIADSLGLGGGVPPPNPDRRQPHGTRTCVRSNVLSWAGKAARGAQR